MIQAITTQLNGRCNVTTTTTVVVIDFFFLMLPYVKLKFLGLHVLIFLTKQNVPWSPICQQNHFLHHR